MTEEFASGVGLTLIVEADNEVEAVEKIKERFIELLEEIEEREDIEIRGNNKVIYPVGARRISRYPEQNDGIVLGSDLHD